MSIERSQTRPIPFAEADFEFTQAREGVRIARLINDPMPTPFGGGVMEFDGGEVADWTLPYDEVSVVLSGELRVRTEEGVSVTPAGGMVVIPRGATVTYSASPGTRVAYVVHPRNWRTATTD